MRNPVQTDHAPAAIGPYAQAVRVDNLLFTSGQIPLRPDGTLLEGDVRAQTEQVLKNLRAVLEAGGSSLANVVKCTCFLADMGDFAAMNEVYGTFFGDSPPARSAVEVARSTSGRKDRNRSSGEYRVNSSCPLPNPAARRPVPTSRTQQTQRLQLGVARTGRDVKARRQRTPEKTSAGFYGASRALLCQA